MLIYSANNVSLNMENSLRKNKQGVGTFLHLGSFSFDPGPRSVVLECCLVMKALFTRAYTDTVHCLNRIACEFTRRLCSREVVYVVCIPPTTSESEFHIL